MTKGDRKMKDEEMAEEIANKRCHEIMCFGHCNFSSPKHHRCGEWHREYNSALEGLKAGRPQWHDLRKDPNDLPKDTTSLYLVRVYSWDFGLSHLYKKYGMYIPTVCEWSGEHFKALNDMAYSNARNIKSCIAWCEIPTFDKETEK